MAQDFYETLGVPRDAEPADIQRAYRRLARQHHPDINKDSGAEERFKDIAEAYDCLLYTSPSPRDGLLSRMPSSA